MKIIKKIQFDTLDKTQTYCGYSISKGMVSARIQAHAMHFLKFYYINAYKNVIDDSISLKDFVSDYQEFLKDGIASHSFILFFYANSWWVYESRFNGGVQFRPARDALDCLDVNVLYPVSSFNKADARFYLGWKYSKRGIQRHMFDKIFSWLTGVYKNIDFLFSAPQALFCTEYVDKITDEHLSAYFKTKSYYLLPVHQQLYCYENKITPIVLPVE